jgi:C1A family cysteine protease
MMSVDTTPGGHGLGYIPDAPDERDYLLEIPVHVPHEFVDLENEHMPPIWDQEQLGSCVAHSTVAAMLYAASIRGADDEMLSRLQVYWNGRVLEGTTNEDSGLQIRDGIKAAGMGVAPETDWPYDISKFTVEPPEVALEDASENVATEYASVETSRAGLQECLSQGYPIVNGLSLFESFESDEAMSTGIVGHPRRGEQFIGGHSQLIVGIGLGWEWKKRVQFAEAEDDHLYVKVRNSWGPNVYEGGYLLMNVPYQSRHGRDFWVIRNVT